MPDRTTGALASSSAGKELAHDVDDAGARVDERGRRLRALLGAGREAHLEVIGGRVDHRPLDAALERIEVRVGAGAIVIGAQRLIEQLYERVSARRHRGRLRGGVEKS